MSKKTENKAKSLLESLALVNEAKVTDGSILTLDATENFENVTGVGIDTVNSVGSALDLYTSATGLAVGQYGHELIKENEDDSQVSVSAEIEVGNHFTIGHRFLSAETVNGETVDNVLRSSLTANLDLEGQLTDVRNRVTSGDFE